MCCWSNINTRFNLIHNIVKKRLFDAFDLRFSIIFRHFECIEISLTRGMFIDNDNFSSSNFVFQVITIVSNANIFLFCFDSLIGNFFFLASFKAYIIYAKKCLKIFFSSKISWNDVSSSIWKNFMLKLYSLLSLNMKLPILNIW